MRTALAGGLIAMATMGVAAAQEMPQRGDVAFGRQPMIRGTATASAADHLTIKTDTGETYTVAISANTRIIREDRMPGTVRARSSDAALTAPKTIKAEEIKPGDGIAAMGELDAPKKTVHALFIGVMDAEQVRKLREGMGKEYIAGKITTIDEVKLTILRTDNVSQVIEVDETTSFRKAGRRSGMRADGSNAPSQAGGNAGPGAGAGTGGESVTLADLKVGDVVAGQGGLKHGIFVPTSLTVMPPGAMTPRMRREGAPTAQPGATPNQ